MDDICGVSLFFIYFWVFFLFTLLNFSCCRCARFAVFLLCCYFFHLSVIHSFDSFIHSLTGLRSLSLINLLLFFHLHNWYSDRTSQNWTQISFSLDSTLGKQKLNFWLNFTKEAKIYTHTHHSKWYWVYVWNRKVREIFTYRMFLIEKRANILRFDWCDYYFCLVARMVLLYLFTFSFLFFCFVCV